LRAPSSRSGSTILLALTNEAHHVIWSSVEMSPADNFDATPLSFAFSGALFTWALYRTYLFPVFSVDESPSE